MSRQSPGSNVHQDPEFPARKLIFNVKVIMVHSPSRHSKGIRSTALALHKSVQQGNQIDSSGIAQVSTVVESERQLLHCTSQYSRESDRQLLHCTSQCSRGIISTALALHKSVQ